MSKLLSLVEVTLFALAIFMFIPPIPSDDTAYTLFPGVAFLGAFAAASRVASWKQGRNKYVCAAEVALLGLGYAACVDAWNMLRG